jgi:hypothetical protein
VDITNRIADQISEAHLKSLLVDSSISQDIIDARGYTTITRKVDLRGKGFAESQLHVPALLLPIWGVTGEVVGYQARPDSPRFKSGKAIKYETPFGMSMALDVHPHQRHLLRDPKVNLFITEGIKKGDALASRGLCAIALLGVWNWRGTNDLGGKTSLADWESIALNSRKVLIVFDSDAMLKIEVHSALARLGAFLQNRGANVHYIYLPADLDQ